MRETITTHVSELSADAGALVIRPPGAPERRLEAAEVAAVHTMAPVVIPPGAHLLVEGDRPRDHMASILIALVLVTFGAFNIAALVRNRRKISYFRLVIAVRSTESLAMPVAPHHFDDR